MCMSGIEGHGKREQGFVARWTAVRRKGKGRYVMTRGLLFGLPLYAVWLAVTLIEIAVSEFRQALFDRGDFAVSMLIWFVVYMTIGMVLAAHRWRANEAKYRYLT
ncbi:hypothetical protein IJ21_31520 [Paenibacillus sp. 32O-W]|nr:hypothetical protein IJ21_31520 [Paenibacillus sp. 32O-W]